MMVHGALAVVILVCAGCALPPSQPPLPATPVAVTPATPATPTTPAPGTTTLPTLSLASPAAAVPVATEEETAAVKESRPSDDTERLLAYFERLRRLQGAELTKEHETARAAFGRATSEYNRVGYAMALSLPGTAFNDDARALELLGPLLKKSDNGLRPLAALLTTFIQERRRLGGDLAAVQQKLAALKSLERTLIERDQNNSGRKP